jgi:hypothetical protein
VDALGSETNKRFYEGEKGLGLPTALACMHILETLNLDLYDLNIVVLGQGELVGKPVSALLHQKGYTHETLRSKTENKDEILKNADIIISGIGRGAYIKGDIKMDSTLSYTRIHDDVLSSIDDIDDVVLESEFSVLNAMLDSYNKATIIMENYNGDAIDSFSIFQEEGILDEATGKKSEALITRILAFIPRLIMAIGKRLIGCSKNEDIKEAAVIIKDEETNEAPMTPEEKTRVQKWREEHSDSTVDIDGAKNKFLKFTGNIKEKCHLLSVTK